MDNIDHELPIEHAITLEIQRESGNEIRRCTRDGLVDGKCPGCGSEPFRTLSTRLPDVDGDMRRVGARCHSCADPVGWVSWSNSDASRRARGETIFGAEEDRAILEMGRARVYR